MQQFPIWSRSTRQFFCRLRRRPRRKYRPPGNETHARACTRNDGRPADRYWPVHARVSIRLCACLRTRLYACLHTSQRVVISTVQKIDQFTLPALGSSSRLEVRKAVGGRLGASSSAPSSAATISAALTPEFGPNADGAATAAAQTSRTRAGHSGLQATTPAALLIKRRAVSKRCMNVAISARAMRGLDQIVADLLFRSTYPSFAKEYMRTRPRRINPNHAHNSLGRIKHGPRSSWIWANNAEGCSVAEGCVLWFTSPPQR